MRMESSPQLTARIALEPNDVYDPFLYSWRNVIRWAIIFFAGLLIYDVGPAWFARFGLEGSRPLFTLLLIIGIAAVVLGVPWLRLLWMFSKYPVMRRSRLYSLSPAGMHIESEDMQVDYNWSLFDRIAGTRKSFVFMVTSRGATYLPKRCLAGTAEVAILRQLIRENFKGKKTLRID